MKHAVQHDPARDRQALAKALIIGLKVFP